MPSETAPSPSRLAIMGGTFDPIHYGHLIAAEEARERFSLDEVVFVPNGTPAHKEGRDVSGAEHRSEMCRLAIASNPRFRLSRLEIERSGPSYSVDTIRWFRSEFPDLEKLYFITGADAVLEILTWRKAEEMIRECEFIAAARPGADLGKLREVLAPALLERIHLLAIPEVDISSSELRRRIREGRTIRYQTPDEVAEYIGRHSLYR